MLLKLELVQRGARELAAARPRGGHARMKIMTILGTRPEIIRLSRVIPLLDAPLSTSWSTPARTTTLG